LPLLCAMAWTPLLFFAIDRLLQARSIRWTWLGSFALAMMVIAGSPQVAYYSGFAALIYFLLQLAWVQQRFSKLACMILLLIAAATLPAVQLFPGVLASQEMLHAPA